MKRNPVAWAALIIASAALLSSAGFLRTIPAAPKVSEESQRTAKALSEAFGAVADFVRPSVVQISVQKKAGAMSGLRNLIPGSPNRRFQVPNPRGNGQPTPKDFEEFLRRMIPDLDSGNPEREQFGPGGRNDTGLGSGFVYDNRGHILTNNHVVENSEKIEVTFHDGVKVKATVVGTDKRSDVAVIKVENTSYPPLHKADSSRLKVGELVMAVGSPFGFSQTVTTGIISALERNAVGVNEYESFIQTDAAINRGNSGGPLVDMNGDVIGINSVIVSGSSGNDGIGFSIPINMASSVAEMLIKNGKVQYARIGIALAPLTPALARDLGLDEATKGVLVEGVVPGSPADKAGLKDGDVIVGFAGEKIANASTFRLKVATSEVSKPYEIKFIREGKERSASVVPAAFENVHFDQDQDQELAGQNPVEPDKTTISDFGLEVQPLTPDLAKQLGMSAKQQGLLVTSVKSGSPASEEGIQEGDVITKVIWDHKPQPLTTVKQFQGMVSKSDELSLFVQTGKLGGRYVTLSKKAK
jgi:serine protease Do